MGLPLGARALALAAAIGAAAIRFPGGANLVRASDLEGLIDAVCFAAMRSRDRAMPHVF